MLKLRYEILDFCEFIKLSKKEINLREKTFNYIKSIIESKFDEYKRVLYGSFKTDLSLPDSDIDILIVEKENKTNEENTEKEKDILTEIIKKIYNILFDTKNHLYRNDQSKSSHNKMHVERN